MLLICNKELTEKFLYGVRALAHCWEKDGS